MSPALKREPLLLCSRIGAAYSQAPRVPPALGPRCVESRSRTALNRQSCLSALRFPEAQRKRLGYGESPLLLGLTVSRRQKLPLSPGGKRPLFQPGILGFTPELNLWQRRNWWNHPKPDMAKVLPQESPALNKGLDSAHPWSWQFCPQAQSLEWGLLVGPAPTL